MRDPRLVEIDFLMELELADGLQIHVEPTAELARYGTSPMHFRDMLVALIANGHVTSSALHRIADRGFTLNAHVLEAEGRLLSELICRGEPVDAVITHSGRVHMWNMRDALLRDGDLDPLGLKNKAAWRRDLFLRLQWAGPDEPLSIVFLDLDHFGKVNEEKGHRIGDEVLQATFDIVKNLVGGRGDVYRYGGEEVGVLLPGLDLEEASKLAEELRVAIETAVVTAVPELGGAQTASLGVSTYRSRVDSDRALDFVNALEREAKDAGRNRVVARAFTG